VASHVLGWGLATVIVMNDPLECFVISALHELLEVWNEPIYPPFAECWWDKYILDMGGNAIGCFVLGPLVAKVLLLFSQCWARPMLDASVGAAFGLHLAMSDSQEDRGNLAHVDRSSARTPRIVEFFPPP